MECCGMSKNERLDVIVATYQERACWFEKLVAVRDDQLDARIVERIVQRVRWFAGQLVQAAEDLRAEAGLPARQGGRPRMVLSVDQIKREYEADLRERGGRGKVEVVEGLAGRFGVSKRTIYRALATPS
jgi:hypothetical protein